MSSSQPESVDKNYFNTTFLKSHHCNRRASKLEPDVVRSPKPRLSGFPLGLGGSGGPRNTQHGNQTWPGWKSMKIEIPYKWLIYGCFNGYFDGKKHLQMDDFPTRYVWLPEGNHGNDQVDPNWVYEVPHITKRDHAEVIFEQVSQHVFPMVSPWSTTWMRNWDPDNNRHRRWFATIGRIELLLGNGLS